MTLAHGTILGGLSTVPDLSAALVDYRNVLGLQLVESGELAEDLAAAWECPGNAGSPYAVLRPASGAPCWFRLVEQQPHPDFRPTTSFGWGAFELTVKDVYGWPERLAGSGFETIGEPRALPGMDAFVPMQALGPGREMIYLNEVFGDMEGIDLPRARSPADRIFICILAAPDRAATCRWYVDTLGLDEGATITLPYTMINRAFGLPPEHLSTLTMVQAGRMPIAEVDDYPAEATARPRHPGMLPPGNALVTLGVRSLAECDCRWIAPPAQRNGALYESRMAATVVGPAGELLELVEIG